jgi:hypothetical protein
VGVGGVELEVDVGFTEPQALPVQFAPESDQSTVVFVKPVKLPVKGCVLLTSTVAVDGVMLIVTTVKLKVVLWVTGTLAASVPLMVMLARPVAVLVVVLIVTVEVPVGGRVIVEGLNVHVTPVGPLQDGVIVPE